MREIAHQKCLLGYFLFGFFQRLTAEAAELIFTHNTSNDVVPRKDVPFWGSKTKNLTLHPSYSRKPPFWGPLLSSDGT